MRGGGLVAFPTETVYGLGANARCAAAVLRIFACKGRPADNPLIVHVADAEAAAAVTRRWTPLARVLAARWWPGPLTLVLDADPQLPAVTTGARPTVGVRVPQHPVGLPLLRQAGIPVAAPSANRSGRPSPTTADHVLTDLGALIDMVLDGGACTIGVESTVVDARGDAPVILREGAISREQLEIGETDPRGDAGAAPGTRYRHYAPSCRVEMVAAGDGPRRAMAAAIHGMTVALVARVAAEAPVITVAVVSDAADLARRLYGAMREAEVAGADLLIVEEVQEVGIGRAVMDRLRRAAAASRSQPG
ncbi:MAG: L-threonylcarbamoyladenylate synthase [Actinomycetota bacterium]|nr:L-threonylcarbamoyladenylate synthase [Actinomycetota bacterium]